MVNRLLILVFVQSVSYGCDQSKGRKTPPEAEQIEISKVDSVITYTSLFVDLDTVSPIKFLEMLKVENGKHRCVKLVPSPSAQNALQGSLMYDIQVPPNWIKKQHIDDLVLLMDNSEPTIPIFSVYGDMTTFDHPHSTVGIEATRMIDGYRKNFYPSLWPEFNINEVESLNCIRWKEDAKRWYNQHK
mgnify:CR=1 FL=1